MDEYKYDYRDATQHTNAYRHKSEQKNKNHLNHRFNPKSDKNDYMVDEHKNNITPMDGVTLEESFDTSVPSLILFFQCFFLLFTAFLTQFFF